MAEAYFRLRAPFAAFRWMQAGVYRATSPVIPPSAAWGLLLNFCGIESRGPIDGVVTGIDPDAPAMELAIGTVNESTTAVLYQQLHSYPVGQSGKEFKERTYGAKYWIAPAKREILVDFDCVVAVRCSDRLLTRMAEGLRGELEGTRYGLPFAGDNNFLFDSIEFTQGPPIARWYRRIDDNPAGIADTCRLTIGIDRKDSSRTVVGLFARELVASSSVPESAWTWTPRKPT